MLLLELSFAYTVDILCTSYKKLLQLTESEIQTTFICTAYKRFRLWNRQFILIEKRCSANNLRIVFLNL